MFLALFLAGTMTLQVGCSSSDTAEDSSDESADLDSEESSEESSDSESSESADSEEGENSEGGEESADAEEAEGDGEETAENAGGEEAAEEEGEEVAEEDEDLEEGEGGEETAQSEEAPPPPVEKVEEPTPPPAVADTSTEPAPAEPTPEVAPEPPPMPRVSLKKIKEAPFDVGGTILNTVYIARPGDNVRGIAKKLEVGRNELVRWNSHIAGGVKPGDKVYYRSQTRPDDTSTMLTYYEDKGIAAQNYEAQEGENIRAIGKKLIGSSEGWKELWATNLHVESKGELPGGTVLRYWSEDAASNALAATPPPEPPAPPAPPPPPPPPPVAMNPPPPPPDPNQGLPQQPLDNTNPDAAAMGSVGAPPPPGARPKPKDVAQADALGLSEENIYLIGGGGLVLLTLLFMVASIRKKKARQLADSQTQI